MELVSTPAWDRHPRALATHLRERCALLPGTSARELPDWTPTRIPAGGLHLWAQLPPRLVDSAVADAARAHGGAVNAGARYFPAEQPGAFLRLGFAASENLADLAEGVRRLGAAARACATA